MLFSVPVRVRLHAGGVRAVHPVLQERDEPEEERRGEERPVLGGRHLQAHLEARVQAGDAHAHPRLPDGAHRLRHGGRRAAAADRGRRGEGEDHHPQHHALAPHGHSARGPQQVLARHQAAQPHAQHLWPQVRLSLKSSLNSLPLPLSPSQLSFFL